VFHLTEMLLYAWKKVALQVEIETRIL